jgi:hypothetical protein
MIMQNLNGSLSEVKSEPIEPISLHERKVELQKKVQRQEEQQEKEQLFQSFIHHVKTKGQYNYPELVDAVLAAYEVSIAPTGTILLARQVDAICTEVQNACDQISLSSHEFEVALQALGTSLCEGAGHMQARQRHSQRLAEILQMLGAGVDTLNDLTREYALSSKVEKLPLQKFDVNAKDEQAWIRYCCESLCYIRQFLMMEVLVDVTPHAFMDWNDYTKRLMDYCVELRLKGSMLCDRLKNVVKGKQFNHRSM